MFNCDDITAILVAVVASTNGWAVVVIFGLYIAYRSYAKYVDARKQALIDRMVDFQMTSISNLEINIGRLVSVLERRLL